MFLYGKNSVFERLKVNPQSIKMIYLKENFSLSSIEKLIKDKKVPFKRLASKEFFKIINSSRNHQGIIALVEEFKYAVFDELVYSDKNLIPIFLDRVYDPQNLGAIIRTCACLGGFFIVIPKHKACLITETVLHISQGGENYVPICMVSNFPNALISLKKRGYWIVGATLRQDALNIEKISFSFPLALVLGSEAKDLRYGVDKFLDMRVKIPMREANFSLNVAMACAIFCYEISKQRNFSRNEGA
ncbi:MAG: 23S rRNA (guanosine(2251)-2'-O)-methyltransferase RlmB [Candidatus Aenigmatarchaeota archaeon]